MKKTLAVILSMLMIFSMVGVMAFAEDEATNIVTYVFINEGQEIKRIEVDPFADAFVTMTPHIPENPSKPNTETTEYIFKGWVLEGGDGTVYYQTTIPAPTQADAGKTFTYVASYSENDISGYQSFWNFVESIFERINLLFQYFAEIFQW